MVEVVFSARAIDDLREIAEYIERDSPRRAADFIRQLRDRAGEIGVLPNAGRVIPELGDPRRREVILGAYRIMYHVSEQRVTIVHVRHAAREFDG